MSKCCKKAVKMYYKDMGFKNKEIEIFGQGDYYWFCLEHGRHPKGRCRCEFCSIKKGESHKKI